MAQKKPTTFPELPGFFPTLQEINPIQTGNTKPYGAPLSCKPFLTKKATAITPPCLNDPAPKAGCSAADATLTPSAPSLGTTRNGYEIAFPQPASAVSSGEGEQNNMSLKDRIEQLKSVINANIKIANATMTSQHPAGNAMVRDLQLDVNRWQRDIGEIYSYQRLIERALIYRNSAAFKMIEGRINHLERCNGISGGNVIEGGGSCKH